MIVVAVSEEASVLLLVCMIVLQDVDACGMVDQISRPTPAPSNVAFTIDDGSLVDPATLMTFSVLLDFFLAQRYFLTPDLIVGERRMARRR